MAHQGIGANSRSVDNGWTRDARLRQAPAASFLLTVSFNEKTAIFDAVLEDTVMENFEQVQGPTCGKETGSRPAWFGLPVGMIQRGRLSGPVVEWASDAPRTAKRPAAPSRPGIGSWSVHLRIAFERGGRLM